MAEPTPGRPGGGNTSGPTSATAATFVVNDKSLKDLHATWRILIQDVKDFNKELQNLQRGAKTVDQLAAKLGSLGMGGGGDGVRTVSGTGGRMPGMPPVPGPLPQNVAHLGMPGMGPPADYQPNMGSNPPLAGGSTPWLSRNKGKIEGGLAIAATTAMFYSRRMDDITDSDLFFNQQAQNTGYGYRTQEKNNVRNGMFGRPGGQGPQGGGLTGYQSVQDALGGARAVFGATGGTWGGRGTAQLRAAGQLSVLNPDMGLAASGAAVGSLYDPTTSFRAASMGMGPTVGMRGQLRSPQAIYQAILQQVYSGRKPTARMITEGLQPGANLYVTLTEGMGLTPDAIEQFARYAIAQANLGGNAKDTDRAVALASKWASGGDLTKSEKRLVSRAGLTDNVRTARNAQGAAGARQTIEAGRETAGTLESGFHALADVTDRLTDVFEKLYKVSNGATGTLLGGAALGSGAVNSLYQTVGGVGGGIFAYQGLRQMFTRGGEAGTGARGVAGAATKIAPGSAEWGAPAAEGAAATSEGLMAAAGPVGIAIAAAFMAHIAGNALKSDAHRRGGLTGRAENVVGQHLSSSWKAMLNPGGYAKDMWNSVAHFAAGGVVPGHHDRDDVDIKATPGELVVPKSVVHLHGGADSLMRKLGFRGQGQGGHYASGGEVTGDTQGLNPDFFKRLKAWSAYVGQPFNVGSGYRSLAEQKVLYDRWMRHVPGQAKAAKPGSSNHNYGLAADGPRWRDKHPEKFGLRYPMSFEPWHVEPDNAKAMRGGAPMSDPVDTSASDGTPPSGDSTTTPTTSTYVTAPRTATDEKSAYASWLAKANTMYGVNQTPSSTTSPNASGNDSTQPAATTNTAPSDPSGNVKLGQQKAAARGWTGSEWDALYNLFQKESGWRTDAANSSSSARGIAQTMMSVHFGKNWQKDQAALDFMRDPSKQIDWGLNYIASRYTTPSKAWAHSQKFNWYDVGAWSTDNETAVLHKDEMVVPAGHARKLRSLLSSQRNQAAMAQPPSYGGGGGSTSPVSISLSMPIQVVGKATVDDAKHLVGMVRDALQEDAELAKMGSG